MKKITLLIVSALLGLCFVAQAQTASLKITMLDNSTTTYTITDNGVMITDNAVQVYPSGMPIVNLLFDNIKSMLFEEIPDTEAPTVSNKTITVGAVTANSIAISWNKATDNVTQAENLRYWVFCGNHNSVFDATAAVLSAATDKASSPELSGTNDVFNFTIDKYLLGILQYFAPNTTYYFTVLVKDEAGNASLYTGASATTTAAAGLAELQAAGIKVWTSPGTLHISTPQAEDIDIYNITGTLVETQRAASGDTNVQLPQGVYVLRIKGEAVKVIVK